MYININSIAFVSQVQSTFQTIIKNTPNVFLI